MEQQHGRLIKGHSPDSTLKMAMIVGRKSAVVAGVETFLFSRMTQGMWIMPGTRMPPSHDEALHCTPTRQHAIRPSSQSHVSHV